MGGVRVKAGTSGSESMGNRPGEESRVSGEGDSSSTPHLLLLPDSLTPTLNPLGTSISLTTTTLAPISPAIHSSVSNVLSSSDLLRPTRAPESATPNS